MEIKEMENNLPFSIHSAAHWHPPLLVVLYAKTGNCYLSAKWRLYKKRGKVNFQSIFHAPG
jgi:hypothetical protein